MICKNCGHDIPEGSTFCGNCGMKPGEENFQNEGCCPNDSYSAQAQQPYYAEAQANYPMEKPNTTLWIVLNAISIFTCCQITGIIGLIFSIFAHNDADRGDYAHAAKNIKNAKICFWVGLALGILIIAIYVIYMALIVGTATFGSLFALEEFANYMYY